MHYYMKFNQVTNRTMHKTHTLKRFSKCCKNVSHPKNYLHTYKWLTKTNTTGRYWGEHYSIVLYLHNHIPSSIIMMAPWVGKITWATINHIHLIRVKTMHSEHKSVNLRCVQKSEKVYSSNITKMQNTYIPMIYKSFKNNNEIFLTL